MPPPPLKKYSDMLATAIFRGRPSPGTMPADMKVIKQILESKFADRKFLESFVNEVIGMKEVTIRMK